ncbi:low affinity immunoglobulin gamma Fc region receptor II-like isoform X2 [Anoplopoma fimbria]|uniref:low affinity immunoglobulin gamma Fc region receptor II-like isoform X2 n=1 Tax=Anoplopoma fimbria TaxID=229290 RepID=UPI0023EC94B9|nr:low affinity immunoglobulin gamma Fc region receptor II-like isoform X2 [Anoplopoma fimbria]
MAITTLCAVVAALRVVPDKSQFFQYESVSLSCGQQETSADWRVKKNTSTSINQECSTSTERMNESHCFIGDLYPLDTGTYWCESAAGQCSDAVDIFVISGSVILESPALPVMEGDDVTLSCITTSSSNLTADFYKDGLLIESSWTGNITVLSVSQSDEGLYRCDVSGGGRSPESRLTVRGRLDLPDSPITRLLLPVVGFCLSLVLLVSLMLLCLWRSHKGKERDVSYTDVIITQEPNRITDVSVITATFYSTVKPGNT